MWSHFLQIPCMFLFASLETAFMFPAWPRRWQSLGFPFLVSASSFSHILRAKDVIRVVVAHGWSWISVSPVEIFLELPPHRTLLHQPIMPYAQTRLPLTVAQHPWVAFLSIERRWGGSRQKYWLLALRLMIKCLFVSVTLSSPGRQDPGFILVQYLWAIVVLPWIFTNNINAFPSEKSIIKLGVGFNLLAFLVPRTVPDTQ